VLSVVLSLLVCLALIVAAFAYGTAQNDPAPVAVSQSGPPAPLSAVPADVLPGSQVECAEEDSYGCVWVAGPSGTSFYAAPDGSTFYLSDDDARALIAPTPAPVTPIPAPAPVESGPVLA
jgi:hypothetical protein